MIIAFKIILGFILLLLGGEILVRGSVGVAKKLEVSPLVIGIILVGFGTSMPELVTCLEAAMRGAPDLATGNVIGSNIANILLIVGAAALAKPILTPIKAFKRDSMWLAFFTLAFMGACLMGSVGRAMGVAFVMALFGYLGYIYTKEKRAARDASAKLHAEGGDIAGETPRGLTLGLMMTFGGIALTIFGAKSLVSGATELATNAGISEAVIGLTIVAIGTSLPELATAIIAGLKDQSDVSLGNIIGSNIFNMMGIFGATAAFKPLVIPAEVLGFDLWVMVGVTVFLLYAAFRDQKLSRTEGGIFLVLYAAYLGFLFVSQVGGA